MKSIKFITGVIFSLSVSIPHLIFACAAVYREQPKPNLLITSYPSQSDIYMERNLKLWQAQTSKEIPLSDIKDVIYGDTWIDSGYTYDVDCYNGYYIYRQDDCGNLFLRHLLNTCDNEAINFIQLAKNLASLRKHRNSPWYYPKHEYDRVLSFESIINGIECYNGTRFYNRYSLQLIRALFASAQYEECIAAFEKRFENVDDNDLMKQMARDYVAGALFRTGNMEQAENYFAQTGDVESLARFVTYAEDAINLVYSKNPNSPKLKNFITYKLSKEILVYKLNIDSTFVKKTILPLAIKATKSTHIKDKEFWYYVAAYCESEFNYNKKKAYPLIAKAYQIGKKCTYSDNIRAYKMALEADLGITYNLISDLKWLEKKISDPLTKDLTYWQMVMQHIILNKVCPSFIKSGDYITALQLANYAENVFYNYNLGDYTTESRVNPKCWNNHDYCNTFFDVLCFNSSHTIERYIASLDSQSPLSIYINAHSYTNKDYLYDLLGTVYLRERDYVNAVRVLSKVSSGYQQLLNVDRAGFLRRDPFQYQSLFQRYDWEKNRHTYNPGPLTQDSIKYHKKLYFAREMLRLEKAIATEKNPDKRAMARLKYSIGLENSFNSSWALTSYSRGFIFDIDPDDLNCWSHAYGQYYPIDEDRLIREAIDDAKKMRDLALNEILSPEVLAEAHYSLYNYATIAQHLPNTKIGRYLASECDHWSDWLKPDFAGIRHTD